MWPVLYQAATRRVVPDAAQQSLLLSLQHSLIHVHVCKPWTSRSVYPEPHARVCTQDADLEDFDMGVITCRASMEHKYLSPVPVQLIVKMGGTHLCV